MESNNHNFQVTLVVNVASLCGYTESTYRALKKLHDILSKWESCLAFNSTKDILVVCT